ncbi:MAG: hypothetical protein MK088_05220 [Alteromonas sp.]|nr:hypothetical protein [Alteromonas sp.]
MADKGNRSWQKLKGWSKKRSSKGITNKNLTLAFKILGFLTGLLGLYALLILTFLVTPESFNGAFWSNFKDVLLSKQFLITLSVIIVFSAVAALLEYLKFIEGPYVSWMYLCSRPLSLPTFTLITLVVGIWASVNSAALLEWIQGEERQSVNVTNLERLVETSKDYEGLVESINALAPADAPQMPKGTNFFVWALFLSFAGMYVNQVNAMQKEKLKEARESERNKTLSTLIELAPASDFHELLGNYVDIIEDFSFDLFSQQSIEVLEARTEFDEGALEADKLKEIIGKTISAQQNYIRAALYAMGRLAASFDQASISPNSDVRYRVNLMMKFEIDALDSLSETHRYFPSIKVEPDFLLEMNNDYAVVLKDDRPHLLNNKEVKFAKDHEQRNCTMPVFVKSSKEQLDEQKGMLKVLSNYNLFGAPESIRSGQPQYINDTVKEVEAWRADGGVQELADEATEYFTKNAKAKSLISIPLSTSRYNEDDLNPSRMIAALNIIRDEKGMLSNTKKADQFFHITRPIIISLSRMLNVHAQILNERAVADNIIEGLKGEQSNVSEESTDSSRKASDTQKSA